MTRTEFERALDEHQAQIQLRNHKWYDVRRNGRTKTWKRWPDRWYIPIKWGLCYYGRIELAHLESGEVRLRPTDFNPVTRV